ncbi:MAG: deoxyribose-phosphate aldolase [Deltaproteobacteria bacterium]|nr:deoxyribose-phosphate aldolase [Deltaproteobacteria bacterium]
MQRVLTVRAGVTKPLPSFRICRAGVNERVHDFCSRKIIGQSRLNALYQAIRMVDLTTLEGCDTAGKIRQLCAKARTPLSDPIIREQFPLKNIPALPAVAAVCVYPEWVACAKKALEGSSVKVASVATGFPAGQVNRSIRQEDTRQALDAGADEIDMVINRGAFLSGDYQKVYDEIAEIRELCGEQVRLKVILETGEIGDAENIRLASWLAMEAGADFIKTSTGKIPAASSMSVSLHMLYGIREFFRSNGRKIGMKPAGGIRSAKEAIHYLTMLLETLGEEWLHPDYFRFGASTLLNDLLREVMILSAGTDPYPGFFSVE